MKITGVLGGSFNPIHNAHLDMAECAHNQFDIPEILIMPTAATYYKDGSALASPDKRMEMIRLAIKERNAESFMKPSTLDLDRGGLTYTYDTINELRGLYDKIYFIIGTDSLMYIDKWVKAESFLPQCTLLISLRPGDMPDDIQKQTCFLENDLGAHIEFMNTKVSPVSSSEIRRRIKAKKDVAGMLPDSVIRYIIKNELYIE